MTMNPKNRSDLGIANSDCSYLRPEALCQNGCCIWVFWWILPTKFHSHSQHEWISPKWLWHMRCPIGTACMGILIKNCVSEICIIIWQVCGAYGVNRSSAPPFAGLRVWEKRRSKLRWIISLTDLVVFGQSLTTPWHLVSTNEVHHI